jgi:hypothetical protein
VRVISGVKRFVKNGRYIDIAPDGSIISFGATNNQKRRDNMLIHDFVVVTYEENSTYDDIEFTDAVTVDDSTILYAADTMHWFEAGWNSINNKQIGLNYHGYTLFYDKEIAKFKSILESWVSIFENAPEEFKLIKAMDPDELFKKATVLKELKDVIQLCDEALNEKKVLVHRGI